MSVILVCLARLLFPMPKPSSFSSLFPPLESIPLTFLSALLFFSSSFFSCPLLSLLFSSTFSSNLRLPSGTFVSPFPPPSSSFILFSHPHLFSFSFLVSFLVLQLFSWSSASSLSILPFPPTSFFLFFLPPFLSIYFFLFSSLLSSVFFPSSLFPPTSAYLLKGLFYCDGSKNKLCLTFFFF